MQRSAHLSFQTSLATLAAGETTSTAGSNETDLLTSGGIAANSRGVTNVLMVTTTVRVFNRVHCNTADMGPAVALNAIFVVRASSFHDRLLGTSSASNNADHTAAVRVDRLLHARRQADASRVRISIVRDDGGVVAGSTSNSTTVSVSFLNVTNNSTFGHSTNGKNVANGQLGLLSAKDKLSGVHTFSADENFFLSFVLVRMSEMHPGKRSTSARVMHDLLDNTLGVSVAFSKVQQTVLSSSLASSDVRLEDRAGTLALSTNYAT